MEAVEVEEMEAADVAARVEMPRVAKAAAAVEEASRRPPTVSEPEFRGTQLAGRPSYQAALGWSPSRPHQVFGFRPGR